MATRRRSGSSMKATQNSIIASIATRLAARRSTNTLATAPARAPSMRQKRGSSATPAQTMLSPSPVCSSAAP